MDDERIFAEAFRRHGRPVQPKDLHPNLSKGLSELLEFYQTAADVSKSDVYCGLLDNRGFNAVTTVHNNRGLIGIYLGTLIIVARYAYCLLSDPDMLPQIGDPSIESVEEQSVEALRDPLGHIGAHRYLPRDPTRLHAAQGLSLCAYMILFFHELSHIELCHLDFLRDHLGLMEHQEVTVAPLSQEEALLFRALEWDADCASLMTSLDMWSLFCANFDLLGIESLGIARSWFLAAQLLFWVMDFVQPPTRRGVASTHPSPEARLVNASILAEDANFSFIMPVLAKMDEQERNLIGIDKPALVRWIVKSKFPSHIVENARGASLVDNPAKQLYEAREQYKQIMVRLESYQKLRLKRKGLGWPYSAPSGA